MTKNYSSSSSHFNAIPKYKESRREETISSSKVSEEVAFEPGFK